MRIFADFVVESDLCLPPDAAPIQLQSSSDAFELSISNVSTDPIDSAKLSVRLICDAADWGSASDVAEGKLALALGALTYVTKRKFALLRLVKVVEWT